MIRLRASRRGTIWLLLLALAATVSACTSGSGSTATSAPPTSPPVSAHPSASPPPTPVSVGPTRTVGAASCPFVGQGYVRPTIGERLGRITVQRSGGKVVGCRFYALQGGPLHRSEHLPGRHQPALEITTTRWPTRTDAYNAFVLQSQKGTSATRADFGKGRVGVCFQTDFYPKDKGQDWGCAASKGVVELEVRSVDTTTPFNTTAVVKKVLDALAA